MLRAGVFALGIVAASGAACAGRTRPREHAPIPVTIAVARPAPALPSEAAPPLSDPSPPLPQQPRCAIQGTELHIVGDALRLCAEPGRKCFGRIPGADYRRPAVTSAVLASSLDAAVSLQALGLTVEARVAVASLALYPAGAYPMGGYFVSAETPVTVSALREESLDVTVPSGRDVRSLVPLTARWRCDQLSLEPYRWTGDDVGVVFGLGPDLARYRTRANHVAVRAVPGGPPVAWLHGTSDLVATIVARNAHEIRVLVPVDKGVIVGWTDASAFERPVGGVSPRTRPPRVRMGATYGGTHCPHPVDVSFVTPDGEVNGAARIGPGMAFDPDRLENLLGLVFEVLPGVTARIDDAALVGCT